MYMDVVILFGGCGVI